MNRKRSVETAVFASLIALMLLVLPLVVPSGAVLFSADRAYMENNSLFADGGEEEQYEEEELPEEDAKEAGKMLVLSAGGGSSPEAAEPAALPMDFSAGPVPNPAGFTENGYQDESITVSMEHREIDGSLYHVARVKIAHPSQLRTALAAPIGTKKTNKTSTLARNNNAVVAMNADFYTNKDKGNYLYVVRQGETILFPPKDKGSLHVLIIDSKGDFHILTEDKMNRFARMKEDKDNPILQAFTFGPALVVDGAVAPMPEPYMFDIRGRNPRAAIGQTGPLEYVLVVVDGRISESKGITAETLADFMLELGCVQAFNMDGGNSSALIFNNAFYSHDKTKSERSTSDILYFASAVDPASWQ